MLPIASQGAAVNDEHMDAGWDSWPGRIVRLSGGTVAAVHDALPAWYLSPELRVLIFLVGAEALRYLLVAIRAKRAKLEKVEGK